MSRIPIDIRTGSIKRERVIGIDLGTTNSLVSYQHGEKPVVIADKDTKEKLLPSVVYFDSQFKPIVGSAAKNYLEKEPANTIYSVKRLLGRTYDDVIHESERLGYHIVQDKSSRICQIEISNGKEKRYYSPIDISSMILKALVQRAEDYFEEPVKKAVITVPAYFNDSQRKATKIAATLAGLTSVRVVNEPTAAALAFGLDKSKDGLVAVYDLGGGTFDVSILKLDDGIFDVLSTNGHTKLGGDDIDLAIMDMISGHVFKSLAIDPFQDARHRQALRLAAEEAKKRLSTQEKTLIKLAFGSLIFEHPLTVDELETCTLPTIEKTKGSCIQALKDAGVSNKDLTSVVLVGGSTKSPLVKREVSKIFQKDYLYDTIDPEEAVALGAGVQASVISGEREDVLLLDVTSLTLGIETVGNLTIPIIPRNSKIPARVIQEFTTSADNQTGVDIHVVQGEREFVKDNRSLAKFVLRPIPPMPAGAPRIMVVFELDADGTLVVSAKDKNSGKEQRVEVNPSSGLTDEEVESILHQGIKHADEDIEKRLLVETQQEADALIKAVENVQLHNKNLFDRLPDKVSIQKSIEILKNKMYRLSRDDLRAMINNLNSKIDFPLSCLLFIILV